MVRRLVGMLVAVVLATGCNQMTAPETETDAYIRGTVTSTDGPSGAVLVQAADPAARVESAWVRVNGRTKVERKDGAAGTQGLAIGQVVSVWTTGVEMRSLPVQVTAARIVIE